MQKLSSIKLTGESQKSRDAQTVLEGSPPLSTWSEFNAPACTIPGTAAAPCWGPQGQSWAWFLPAFLVPSRARRTEPLLCNWGWAFPHAWASLRVRSWVHSFDSKSRTFPRQCNPQADWEISVKICWQRRGHRRAPSSFTRLTLAAMPPRPHLWAQPGP